MEQTDLFPIYKGWIILDLHGLSKVLEHKPYFHLQNIGTNLPTVEVNHLFLEKHLINLEAVEIYKSQIHIRLISATLRMQVFLE